MSFFLSYITPPFTSAATVSAFDTSGSYPANEVYTETVLDGAIFCQVFSGSSSKDGVIATLAPVKIYCDLPEGFSAFVAMYDVFVTINDSTLGVIYQVYMQYDPGILDLPWQLEINNKKYGSTNPRDFDYKFTPDTGKKITINA